MLRASKTINIYYLCCSSAAYLDLCRIWKYGIITSSLFCSQYSQYHVRCLGLFLWCSLTVALLFLDGCGDLDRLSSNAQLILFYLISYFGGWKARGSGAVLLIVDILSFSILTRLNSLDVALLLDRSSGVNSLLISVGTLMSFECCKILINYSLDCSIAPILVLIWISWKSNLTIFSSLIYESIISSLCLLTISSFFDEFIVSIAICIKDFARLLSILLTLALKLCWFLVVTLYLWCLEVLLPTRISPILVTFALAVDSVIWTCTSLPDRFIPLFLTVERTYDVDLIY